MAIAVAVQTAGCASAVTGHAGITVANTTGPVTNTTGPVTNTTGPVINTTGITATNTANATTSADWNPRHLSTVTAAIDQGAATIRVGERIEIIGDAGDSVNFSVTPPDLTNLTWYGSDVTFVGLRAGTVTLTIPNYNKHFDCPNGPCAHLNAPLALTVTILPGTAPKIAAPVEVPQNTTDQTIHLMVGQQLRVPATMSLSPADDDGPGRVDQLTDKAGITTLVGAVPGTLTFGLGTMPISNAYVHLTVVVDA